ELMPITATGDATSQASSSQAIKSAKPKVELFVMTYCPYGTQAEKGLIPALNLLGDKIDAKIRFVHYFMHGDKEEQETYTQLCIREEQSGKYLSYLECFLEDGNSARCLAEAGIDKTKLNSCTESKAKGYYASDSALSNSYGVQGSPTLIINGQEASSGRSSSALLSAICSAFSNEPEECSEQVSSEDPAPGFGYVGAGSHSGGNAGSCG
ncbi:thioredoxin domain-containing protein, partial [Candidatus Pacearchaeota archaeon]|nr:thioredoxin domain-containing protein [Candidatus Pacearchaeota archaeon]